MRVWHEHPDLVATREFTSPVQWCSPTIQSTPPHRRTLRPAHCSPLLRYIGEPDLPARMHMHGLILAGRWNVGRLTSVPVPFRRRGSPGVIRSASQSRRRSLACACSVACSLTVRTGSGPLRTAAPPHRVTASKLRSCYCTLGRNTADCEHVLVYIILSAHTDKHERALQ